MMCRRLLEKMSRYSYFYVLLISLTLVFMTTGCSNNDDDKTPDDKTPATFSFTPQTNVALNTVITSNSITVSGINAETTISISGADGTYSINNGAFTHVAGIVSTGNSVKVRLTSSSNYNTVRSVILNIGGVEASFSVTTINEDDPEDLTLDSSYFGSWTSTVEYTDFTSTNFVTFSNDGTYTVTIEGDSDDDGLFHSNSGTWGMTEDGRMFMDSEAGSDGYFYTFFTSTGKLSMQKINSSEIFERDGEGTGLVGTWINGDSDCTASLIFTATRYTFNQTCTDSSDNDSETGSYTVADDIITATPDGGEVDHPYFKIFNDSVLVLDYEEVLYSVHND